ncbi:MAG TPA: endonuclease/exonuclease/phosphatase family protein, partial [Myxococcota bacterium]|nr:endonuclease/exonuclease/phosphatase family protein [Myxococcota bacterium]
MLLLLACTSAPTSPGKDSPGDSPTAHSSPDDSAPVAWEGYGLMSLNLHCFKVEGTPYTDNDARFAAIAAEAAARNVAALAVQEACANQAEGDEMTRLAAALKATDGQEWQTARVVVHTAWEGTADEAEEGVGLLLRAAPIEAVVLDYAVQGALTRRAIAADLPADRGGLRLISTHLDYNDATARRMQARQTAVWALQGRPDAGVLIAGDLNAALGSEPLVDLAAMGFTQLGEPGEPTRIDHVLAPAGAPVVATAELVFDSPETAVSDHPGMVLQLQPAPGGAPALTRLRADVDPGEGHFLSLRGSQAPLDWSLGWPAVPTP